MAAFRSADYQPPCARCNELATWWCECCDVPRCGDHLPEYAWCDACEEDFARSMVTDGLYMVHNDRGSKREPWRDRPAFWSWRHDLRHIGPGVVAIAAGVAAFGALMAGGLALGALFGGAAIGSGIFAWWVPRTPQHQLDDRLAVARVHYLEGRAQKALPPGDESE